MIDASLADFIRGPVMMVIGAAAPDGRPALARGLGASLSHDGGLIEVLCSRQQWPEAVAGLQPGRPMALTVCDASTYRTYQIKGRLMAAADAGPEDLTLAARYTAAVTETLVGLGVGPRQIAGWLTADDLVRLTFVPQQVFHQTPGPGAGRLAEAAP